MNITAVTRFKQGDLHQALRKLGWTQTELARRSGLRLTTVNGIIGLRRRPSAKDADSLQKALGDAGVFLDILALWPESFHGFKHSVMLEQTQDIPGDRLVCGAQARALPAYTELEGEDTRAALEGALSGLTKKEREVLELIYLDGDAEGNTTQLAKTYGVSRCRLYQIRDKALRKLQHPARIVELEDAYEVVTGRAPITARG